MNKKHGILENEEENEDLQDALEAREKHSREEDREVEAYELRKIAAEKEHRKEEPGWKDQLQNPEITMDIDQPGKFKQLTTKAAQKTADLALTTADVTMNKLAIPTSKPKRSSWADREHNRRSTSFSRYPSSAGSFSGRQQQQEEAVEGDPHHHRGHRRTKGGKKALDAVNNFNPLLGDASEVEAQQKARTQLSDALFGGVNDELEDLTPDQRDALVQRAFQHSALRARRPVIWIPRDDLGVSDDELKRMAALSHKYLWVSNVRQGLDAKGRCVYSGTPPDFSEVDLIQL